METITSVKNEKVKAAAKLVSSTKARREQGLFVLEGLRLCMDIVRSDLRCAQLFASDDFREKHGEEFEVLVAVSDEVYVVNDAVLEKLSDTRTPQGVCCVVKMPEGMSLLEASGLSDQTDVSADVDESAQSSEKLRSTSESTPASSKLLLLENVQDPGNLGAMARTAEALGISGLLVSGGCDVYSPKALRASMGALLRLPVEVIGATTADVVECLKVAADAGFKTYASTPSTEAIPVTEVDFDGPTICVVGNEANGVTAEAMDACIAKITIPMAGRAESLNAAAAGAILMWEMVR